MQFKTLGKPEFLTGVFSIILTAMILTVFEIGMFVWVIAPSVRDEMNSNIRGISKKVATQINTHNHALQSKDPVIDVSVSQTARLLFNTLNGATLKTMSTREKKLTDQINTYAIGTGVAVVVVLCVLLVWLYRHLREVDSNADFQTATHTAFLTVALLIGFQVLFYFFGKKYKYPGSKGSDELVAEILDQIDSQVPEKKRVEKQI